MIPTGLLSFALFLASLGPGYLFVRISERRGLRHPRSSGTELVELAVIGTSCTVLVATLLIAIGEYSGLIDFSRLVTDTDTYFDEEPGRILVAALVTYTLSYLLAAGVALGTSGKMSAGTLRAGFTENSNGWLQALFMERPTDDARVVAAIELVDGRTVVGVVRGFTAEEHENREIRLVQPLAMQRSPAAPLTNVPFDFLALREREIRYIAGRYERETDSSPTKKHSD